MTSSFPVTCSCLNQDPSLAASQPPGAPRPKEWGHGGQRLSEGNMAGGCPASSSRAVPCFCVSTRRVLQGGCISWLLEQRRSISEQGAGPDRCNGQVMLAIRCEEEVHVASSAARCGCQAVVDTQSSSVAALGQLCPQAGKTGALPGWVHKPAALPLSRHWQSCTKHWVAQSWQALVLRLSVGTLEVPK